MTPTVLTVARHGPKWGVSSDGTLLVLARTKRAATDTANHAADILRASGGPTKVEVTREPRSFAED